MLFESNIILNYINNMLYKPTYKNKISHKSTYKNKILFKPIYKIKDGFIDKIDLSSISYHINDIYIYVMIY